MKATEERRGEIEEAVLKIVNLCSDPMFYFDSNFKVIEKSRAFEKLDAKIKDLVVSKSGKLKQGLIHSIKNSIRTIILKKGSERYILHITPLCSKEKKNGFALCSIYPYKSVEKSDSPKQKKEFLNIMAHELKSPLSNIGLSIDYILMECRKEKNGAMKKICPFVRKMKKQTFQIITMIDNYLDMSRFKEGFFEPSIERFSLSDLLDEVKELASPLFLGKEVKFKVVNGKKLPDEIESDSEMVKRILINFLANAAKYTEEGEVILKTERKNSEIVFSVCDTGCGIEEAEFEKIFQPFKRGKSAGKRSPGFGLGLSIAKKLASLLKGEIKMESEVKKGSTFSLKIPIYEE
ncbi:MAG: sensor histidine kinase [Acidobacteriota bacterium]